MEFTPPLAAGRRRVPDQHRSMHGWDELAEFGPASPHSSKPVPPQAEAVAHGVARLLTETLTGRRNAKQLGQWLTVDECSRLAAWIRQHRGARIRLSRLRLIEISPGRVEGQLHFDFETGRLCATLSLTTLAGRWTCPQLSVLLPGTPR